MPALHVPEIRFSSEASDPYLEHWMVSAIERGVREFAAERERGGRPIGCLDVALVDIYVHPVDSKAHRFTWAAFEAMTEAFKAHETFVDV